MMEWVRTRDDFCFILVLDVSRWGRFQDTDLSAHYESLCTQHGKQVVYTNIGFTRDEDRLINQLRKSIDRYQSAEYSRTLSKKVFEGAAKVAHQGYRPGGAPPYGFHRLMLDEHKKPDRILQPGQRKAIQNGRVVLVPGDTTQVEVVQEIFVLFVERGFNERQIAGHLNAKNIPSPGGLRWGEASIRHILSNQQYAGAVVYNRTTQRLKTKRRTNPPEEWIITPDSYDPIIAAELFERAQGILEGRTRRHTREQMLQRLAALYEKYNVITSRLIRFDRECPAPATYAAKFGGLSGAFQAMFADVLQRVRNEVFRAVSQEARLVDEHDDFIVINRDFTVLIQPSVPVPDGSSPSPRGDNPRVPSDTLSLVSRQSSRRFAGIPGVSAAAPRSAACMRRRQRTRPCDRMRAIWLRRSWGKSSWIGRDGGIDGSWQRANSQGWDAPALC